MDLGRIEQLALMAIAGIMTLASTVMAADTTPVKPAIAKICINCHKAKANTLLGEFDNVAFKAKTIQMRIDDATVLVKFDEDDIKVLTSDGKNMDGDALHKTKRGQAIKVEYTENNGVKTAVRLVEKPPVKVSPEMLISTPEIEKLIALGPEKGNYRLFDSRPAPQFQEGAIPTAISLPYPAFDKMTDKLPKDTAALLVFYSSGITCNMGPASADKAKKLGYTNIKIYRDGIPAWSEKNATTLSAQSFKDAWLDKDIPHVLLDVRPAKIASKGFIKGAVSFPEPKAAKLAKKLPASDKNPPVILYDAKDGKQAAKAAKLLLAAGYDNVKIISGGFAAWKSALYQPATGKLATKASYVPKPRPGEISPEEFRKYADQLPPTVIIIDVRNEDEIAKTGMLKNAVNIPEEDLKAKAERIPKDKLIITLCTTGVRAEMGYHALKELGYSNVRFLNAKTDFEKDGTYKITKE
jgi:rhodanese-related sulfurtransferase